MGCHTWFYTKIERTQEEATKLWIDEQIESINRWEETTNNVIYDEAGNFIMPHPENEIRFIYPEWSQESCEHHLEVLKRQLRRVQNGGCKKAIWNHQPDVLSFYIEGKGLFVEVEEFHDVFRTGYSENLLFSLQESLDYINNPENNCTVFENTTEKLIEFWNKYPEGAIYFG
jgi:hypothetical protein